MPLRGGKAKSVKVLKTPKALPRKALKIAPKPKTVKPRVPLEKKTAQQLVPVADEAFSKYIRLRDSVRQPDGSYIGTCIDCSKVKVVYRGGRWLKGTDNGHYISRGVHSLRYDEMNCNLQDSHCNAWRDKGDVERDYRKALDKKYGNGTAAELKALSKEPVSHKIPPKDELLDIIYTCRAYIKRELGE